MRAETKTPWYNSTLLTAKRCNLLERRWRRLQTDASLQAYRVQCIALNKLLDTYLLLLTYPLHPNGYIVCQLLQ